MLNLYAIVNKETPSSQHGWVIATSNSPDHFNCVQLFRHKSDRRVIYIILNISFVKYIVQFLRELRYLKLYYVTLVYMVRN